MNKRSPLRLSEPLQIYITADERRMLDTLSAETGLSRAEILRRGLRTFAAQRAGTAGRCMSCFCRFAMRSGPQISQLSTINI